MLKLSIIKNSLITFGKYKLYKLRLNEKKIYLLRRKSYYKWCYNTCQIRFDAISRKINQRNCFLLGFPSDAIWICIQIKSVY